MYDHTRQYRCTIIRGKSQLEVDNILPAYAKVIDEICPCDEEDFELKFNESFKRFLPLSSREKKTFDNHRTEISGKLFGMYFTSGDGMVYESERTQKYLMDSDQPAFFKDICYKMQFPNGMQKSNTIQKRIDANISLRPCAFVIRVLLLAKANNLILQKKDIGYYVLNSLDVLQGKATPEEVVEVIKHDKTLKIKRDVFVPGKASSYTHQHINEQLNYMELANLIVLKSDGSIILNMKEKTAIDQFSKVATAPPAFDVYSYDFKSKEGRKKLYEDWDYYFSKVSDCVELFSTSPNALRSLPSAESTQTEETNAIELGDEGEDFVFKYEKQRVSAFNKRLVNRVIAVGKQRGLGYDIQSVIAQPGNVSDFAKYIEVKSTKRVTSPSIDDNLWMDTLNITRNEWIAARQHHEFFFIYRVYFTRDGITVFIINDIEKKELAGDIQVVPTTYRIDFSKKAVDGYVVANTLGVVQEEGVLRNV